jgi:putative glycosyltransferase (TIGR04348 family)
MRASFMWIPCQDHRVDQPRVCIVSPAPALANNGNWHSADRWRSQLASSARVDLVQTWQGQAADVLMALHARKSADSIARFHAPHPGRPIVLVLTGTDLYGDGIADATAQHSLQCASRIVVLQPRALARLDPLSRGKARVILQSAPGWPPCADKAPGVVEFIAVGHLRAEKDPITLMRAVERLPASAPVRVAHVGNALDESLALQARRTMDACPRYRWLGGLPHPEARLHIARSHALVHTSRVEGGANVVIEAVRSGVPVLASNIDGNTGLLGDDYAGCFPAGDADALSALMLRFAGDAAFAEHLAAQCRRLEPLFAPELEAEAVCGLVRELVPGSASPAAGTRT